MFGRIVCCSLLALAVSSAASANECSVMDVTYEHANARMALGALATAAGFRITNPEIITGKVNARLEEMNPQQAFLALASVLGYEARINGRDVRLSHGGA